MLTDLRIYEPLKVRNTVPFASTTLGEADGLWKTGKLSELVELTLADVEAALDFDASNELYHILSPICMLMFLNVFITIQPFYIQNSTICQVKSEILSLFSTLKEWSSEIADLDKLKLAEIVAMNNGSEDQLAAAELIEELDQRNVPAGPSDTLARNDVVLDILKAMEGMPFGGADDQQADLSGYLNRLRYQRSEAHLVVLSYMALMAARVLHEAEEGISALISESQERLARFVANVAEFYRHRVPGNALAGQLSEIAIKLYNAIVKSELPVLSAEERRELHAEFVVWDTFYDEPEPLTERERRSARQKPERYPLWASSEGYTSYRRWLSREVK